MYKIEKRASGYLLTFAGVIERNEMQDWYNESKAILADEHLASFPVIIDMRHLKPLAMDVQQIMIDGQGLYKQAGMLRSSVIVNDAATVGQFKAIAKKSGIYITERYFDGMDPSAIDNAIEWAKNGADPDLE